MEFVVKTTSELQKEQLQEILDLFNRVFETDRSMDEMLNQYVNNPFGYSYHSMMIVDGKIVGCETFVPVYYLYKGKKVKIANAIDNMIDKHHRDFFNLKDININMKKRLKDDGFIFYYGFPNNVAYPIFKKSKLMLEIGKLDTYCLPYRIGGIKPGLKVLNWASQLFCKAWLYFPYYKKTKPAFTISKDSETYDETRYKRMDGKYEKAHLEGIDFIYKVLDYEGIRSCFLIDISDKSGRAFRKALKYIVKKEGKNFDILLYVGYLPSKHQNIGMVKIPRKYEPKHFNFMGAIVDPNNTSKKTFLDIAQWDVNLSNFDLI